MMHRYVLTQKYCLNYYPIYLLAAVVVVVVVVYCLSLHLIKL
jgi:hypothetical protein